MDTLSATNEISPIAAILWCFYPISALVLVNLFLSFGQDDDDDDDQGGVVMTPVYGGAAAGFIKLYLHVQ